MSDSQQRILNDVHVVEEDGQYVVTAALRWSVPLADDHAPQQLHEEIERMGQQVKREAYPAVLQDVEQRIVRQFKYANGNLQRRGSRRYTFVTAFGRVEIQRTRLFDRQKQKWCVPAHCVWQTPHRECILPALKDAAFQHVSNLSVRKTTKALDEQAGVAKLLSPATLVNICHERGRQLDQHQRQQAAAILDQHPEALSSGLAGPYAASPDLSPNAASPSQASAPSKLWLPPSYEWAEEKSRQQSTVIAEEDAPARSLLPEAASEEKAEASAKGADDSRCVCQGGCLPSYFLELEQEEDDLPELTSQEIEEVRQRAIGFLQTDGAETSSENEPQTDAAHPEGKDGEPSEGHPAASKDAASLQAGRSLSAPEESTFTEPPATARQVDQEWVMLQMDEVLTKAQPCQQAAQMAQTGRAHKRNATYTATIDVNGQTWYLSACCALSLWQVTAALLCRLGVLTGQRGLLVIADGASWIRDWFDGLRLPLCEMVLCWYHLAKRVYERLSQGGFSKSRRQEIEHIVLGHLWQGEVFHAVWYLWGVREEIKDPKRRKWITQLMEYLLKRRAYLPNYQQRHQQGLWIASTRVEKWNDLAVSDRCKRRGMSWTGEGVLSLALYQSLARNGQHLWSDDATQMAA